MRTIMSRTPYDGSFSFSRRNFSFNFNTWLAKNKHGSSSDAHHNDDAELDFHDEIPIFFAPEQSDAACRVAAAPSSSSPTGSAAKRRSAVLSKLRSAFTAALASSAFRLLVISTRPRGIGPNSNHVTGTLFGPRRGRVHLSFQPDPRSPPLLLIELSTPTSSLVSEMASGLVRIALECDRKGAADESATDHNKGGVGRNSRKKRHLVDEPLWRAYCNGRKLGSAVRRDPLESDLDVLRKVGPVSMGAGVVARGGGGEDGGGGGKGAAKGEQVMYMRAGFERVVGSADSMAFYMVGPEGGGGAASGPELSIYLLRV